LLHLLLAQSMGKNKTKKKPNVRQPSCWPRVSANYFTFLKSDKIKRYLIYGCYFVKYHIHWLINSLIFSLSVTQSLSVRNPIFIWFTRLCSFGLHSKVVILPHELQKMASLLHGAAEYAPLSFSSHLPQNLQRRASLQYGSAQYASRGFGSYCTSCHKTCR